jgi:hypothetical protein
MFRKSFVLVIIAIIISCVGQKNPLEGDVEPEIPLTEEDNIISEAKIDYISYLNNLLEVDQVINLTKDELYILRNTIFAKYGYRFVSENLRNYFSQFSWYNGIKNNVENELTEIDWKNIRLIQRLENDLPIFKTPAIEVKIPVYIGVADLPVSSYGWAMKSTYNGRAGFYISPFHFFDTTEMKAIRYLPDNDIWDAYRPPFSNNTMPISYIRGGNSGIINIITNREREMNEDERYAYGTINADAERFFMTARLYTPEYSIVIAIHSMFFYVGKNHLLIPESRYISGNNRIKNMLISEFNGTVFENSFILETIRYLLSSMNIITKYQMELTVDWDSNGQYEYFLERMSTFFDTDLSRYVPIPPGYRLHYLANIYENGFYIYDYSREKLILLDINNMKVIIYNYRECLGSNVFQNDPSFEILLSDNGSYAFLITREWTNRYPYRYENQKVYKLKL